MNKLIWCIAARFHFPPSEIMEMELSELEYWLNGAIWAASKKDGE
jgi:hypothetical protein